MVVTHILKLSSIPVTLGICGNDLTYRHGHTLCAVQVGSPGSSIAQSLKCLYNRLAT